MSNDTTWTASWAGQDPKPPGESLHKNLEVTWPLKDKGLKICAVWPPDACEIYISADKWKSADRQNPPSISYNANDAELEQIFHGLVKIWRDATGGSSSIRRRFTHPTYRAILRLGPETVPFIIKELRERPDWWFDALEFLTGENPTKPTHSFAEASAAWIDWWNNQP